MRCGLSLPIAACAIVMLTASRSSRAPFLVWNASASVPIGLYRVTSAPIATGAFAVVRLPQQLAAFAQRRGYLVATSYSLKPVAAVAGDRVCRFGARLFVRHRHVANANVRDAHGRPLPAWQGCQTVAVGSVFLLAPHPASFDSRYFGPLSLIDIVGRAEPCWLFSNQR
jgi:conjugative transfer signal peptidase TraF